ncbi:AF4/FMR2 family member lilli isoform X3 [Astyanax mexicanus]|uniref:AF4/FMR2 family member lilli isoform X3 n=1 Tax=Astyanax mexicanus TaxID=7994 RepID=UPI0020CB5024|nr:AF4/FMR2 family member lilli isoform X3 [Astyanax mexicanus]
MASSAAPLCPQNQNQRDNPGLLKHQKANKLSENLRTQSHITQSSKRGSENQDPNETAKTTKGANKLKTISRLPVLAKSIQPVLTDIPQSPGLKRWEERPLLGKAQKRKTCTKPVPFNLSQSRSHSQKLTEAAPERAGSSGLPLTTRPTPSKTLTTSQHRTNPPTHNPLSSLRNTHVHHTNTSKTKPLNPLEPKTSPKPKPNSTQSVLQCVTDSSIQRDLSSQLRSITLAQSELTKDPGLSLRAGAGGVEERAAFQLKTKGCIQTALSAKPTTGITGNSTGSTVSFTPDPSALSSILQNEGVKLDGPGATPRVSTCPTGRGTSIYSAQRVPVKKPQTEAAKALPGQAGSAVPFSPDPSALRSILLNEGIKAGGASGATPRVSTCPSGRGTSIYSAQRVPLKKPKAEGTVAEAHTGASRTPNTKRTQQRVPYSQSQSLRRLISARKAALSNLQSPALREAQSSSTDSSAQQQQQQQKDVVQKLFQEEPEQEEHEQMEEEGDEAALGPALERQPTAELHSDKENMVPNNQPFIQAPHRQSVIVFSSGQRLFRPGPTQDCSQISENAGQLQPCVSSTESQSTEPVQPVQPSGSQSSLNSDTSKRSSPSTQCKTKASSSLSSAVCALRRRLPPLEEMFLDEECATYTSCQQAWPTQPRCSNPVASILLFQDSTCFMPIGFGSSSHSPGPLLSSPIR